MKEENTVRMWGGGIYARFSQFSGTKCSYSISIHFPYHVARSQKKGKFLKIFGQS
jgi:hypothetical protein